MALLLLAARQRDTYVSPPASSAYIPSFDSSPRGTDIVLSTAVLAVALAVLEEVQRQDDGLDGEKIPHLRQILIYSRGSFKFLACHCERLCRNCMVQIQPRKLALGHAQYTGPTRQYELDHTKTGNRSALKISSSRIGGSMICARCAFFLSYSLI